MTNGKAFCAWATAMAVWCLVLTIFDLATHQWAWAFILSLCTAGNTFVAYRKYKEITGK